MLYTLKIYTRQILEFTEYFKSGRGRENEHTRGDEISDSGDYRMKWELYMHFWCGAF